MSGETVIDYEYNVTDSGVKLSKDQYLNTITYADGTVEQQIVDKYGNIYKKRVSDNTFYDLKVSEEKKRTFFNYETDRIIQITNTDDVLNYTNKNFPYVNNVFLDYTVTKADDVTTINETHYGDKSYETVISENNIAYTSDAGTISYSYDYESETPTDSVKYNDETVLSSAYSYDSENNITNKKLSCYVGNEWMDLNVYNQYDDNGNITSSGYDADYTYTHYAYDENNQLIRVDNQFYDYTTAYTYDERGNITSKNKYSFTRDEITSNPKASTVYSYDNEKWLDQLTAVNDTPLTYDANGNLASYGDITYTWSHGKWLDTITDGDNTYSYTYDENGIRATKTVNGVKTEFNTLNGRLLSQKTGNDFIYFQYDTNGTPIGFVYNDTQYLYMTNQLGDVISITDAQGKEIIEYEYDEWGSMLDITLKSDDEIVSTLAELNPLRYRGYYYDNETDMYYLQSRYYNPELGRFISADDFSNIDTSKKYFNMNAYIYCWNCPVSFKDDKGTAPTISIDIEAFVSFIKSTSDNVNNKVITSFQENIQKLQNRFDTAVEQAKFYYYNPGTLLSKILSAITGTNINIEFKTLKWIRENRDIDAQSDDSDDEGSKTFSSKSKKKAKMGVSNEGIAVAEIINAIFVCYDALHFNFSNISFINKRNSEDFACFIAAIIVSDKNVLHPSGNSSSEKHNNFVNWMNDQAEYFQELVKTSFYAMTMFCTDFFFRFYEIVVNEKTFFADININRFISLSFGYAYDDETLDAINDALNQGLSGHLPFFSKGNFSSGAILNPPSNVGAYIEYSKNIISNFYGFVDFGVEIDITKLIPRMSSFEISTEIMVVSAIGVSYLLLLGLIEALGSVAASPLVPAL